MDNKNKADHICYLYNIENKYHYMYASLYLYSYYNVNLPWAIKEKFIPNTILFKDGWLKLDPIGISDIMNELNNNEADIYKFSGSELEKMYDDGSDKNERRKNYLELGNDHPESILNSIETIYQYLKEGE